MRAAKLANSERLQRVVNFLSDGAWHSTREIVHGAKVCAVNSAIAELRDPINGIEIDGHWLKKYFYYRLAPKQANA